LPTVNLFVSWGEAGVDSVPQPQSAASAQSAATAVIVCLVFIRCLGMP
jgi:hypothetical protein